VFIALAASVAGGDIMMSLLVTGDMLLRTHI